MAEAVGSKRGREEGDEGLDDILREVEKEPESPTYKARVLGALRRHPAVVLSSEPARIRVTQALLRVYEPALLFDLMGKLAARGYTPLLPTSAGDALGYIIVIASRMLTPRAGKKTIPKEETEGWASVIGFSWTLSFKLRPNADAVALGISKALSGGGSIADVVKVTRAVMLHAGSFQCQMFGTTMATLAADMVRAGCLPPESAETVLAYLAFPRSKAEGSIVGSMREISTPLLLTLLEDRRVYAGEEQALTALVATSLKQADIPCAKQTADEVMKVYVGMRTKGLRKGVTASMSASEAGDRFGEAPPQPRKIAMSASAGAGSAGAAASSYAGAAASSYADAGAASSSAVARGAGSSSYAGAGAASSSAVARGAGSSSYAGAGAASSSAVARAAGSSSFVPPERLVELSSAFTSPFLFYNVRRVLTAMGDVTLTAEQSRELSQQLFGTAGARRDPGLLILVPAMLEEIGFVVSTPGSTPFAQALVAMCYPTTSSTSASRAVTATMAAAWINVLHTMLALTPSRATQVDAVARTLISPTLRWGDIENPFAAALGYDNHDEISELISAGLCKGLEMIATRDGATAITSEHRWMMQVLRVMICFPRPDERVAYITRYVKPVLATLVRLGLYKVTYVKFGVVEGIRGSPFTTPVDPYALDGVLADIVRDIALESAPLGGGAKRRRSKSRR
jgi:hypothetical protein